MDQKIQGALSPQFDRSSIHLSICIHRRDARFVYTARETIRFERETGKTRTPRSRNFHPSLERSCYHKKADVSMAAGRIYRNRWIVVVLTHSQGMPVTSDDISIYRYIKRDRETILDNEMAEKSTVYTSTKYNRDKYR